jgi:hypothetical protein
MGEMKMEILDRLTGYHHFDGFKVDVFGYDEATGIFTYSVETRYSSKVREAKAYYKYPDKRNERAFPFGPYIYIIDPNGKKRRMQSDCRP